MIARAVRRLLLPLVLAAVLPLPAHAEQLVVGEAAPALVLPHSLDRHAVLTGTQS